MLKKIILKFSRSLIKVFLPLISKILIFLKINRRVINFLEEQSYFSNKNNNFSNVIQNLLINEKIVALDVGAQGGFNSDNYFHRRYEKFFRQILIEPIKKEAEKIKSRDVINKALWSKKERRKLYIFGKRPGSTSMYQPDESRFDIHDIKKSEFNDYKVTNVEEIDCDTLENLLFEKDVSMLDYLKIDTQGAELEILKGLGKFSPLLIKVEAHIHSMYKNAPGWHELINYLYKLNYLVIDWKGIGKHNTRIPAEMDIIFIPNFNNDKGKSLIMKNQKKFLSLLLIFGQINLLKIIIKRLKIEFKEVEKFQDFYFY